MSHDPFVLELDKDTNKTLKVFLFKNVKNTDEIKSNLMKGLWKCAAVKPGLVIDPMQIAVAANRAALAHTLGTMVTRSVFTEILFNLSLSKNISQSLKKFGIDKDRELLLCFLISSDNDNSEDVISKVDGESCPLQELRGFTDMKLVNDAYKLPTMKSEYDLISLLVSKVATKGFISH